MTPLLKKAWKRFFNRAKLLQSLCRRALSTVSAFPTGRSFRSRRDTIPLSGVRTQRRALGNFPDFPLKSATFRRGCFPSFNACWRSWRTRTPWVTTGLCTGSLRQWAFASISSPNQRKTFITTPTITADCMVDIVFKKCSWIIIINYFVKLLRRFESTPTQFLKSACSTIFWASVNSRPTTPTLLSIISTTSLHYCTMGKVTTLKFGKWRNLCSKRFEMN